MVRERVRRWSSHRSPEDAAFALVALGLVPEQLRTAEATAPDILSALHDLLAAGVEPARWVLNTPHGSAAAWETAVAVEDLAAAVRDAVPHGRHVSIECGDALDPEDVLDFFERAHETAALRANGWTFATARAGSKSPAASTAFEEVGRRR